jgi:hypothetical protein
MTTGTGNPSRNPEVMRRLLPHVAEALHGSPFERPGRWRQAVVILRREEKRVTSRGDFAGWLASSDLPELARECIARRISPGSILVFIDIDVPSVALASFVVFDLATALRKAKAA